MQLTQGRTLRVQPFSKHVKAFFFGDAVTFFTDGECSAAAFAAAGRGGRSRALPVRCPPFSSILRPSFLSIRLDSSPTPPLNFGHRLAQTFCLECIPIARDHRIGSMEDHADELRCGPSKLGLALREGR